MRFVPFLNVSYVKSGFHLMTVAPSFILRGAGRRAFSISSVAVCANTPAESASMVRTTSNVRFICDLLFDRSTGPFIVAIREQQSWRLVQYKRSKPVGHQHSAFRANGRLSVLASNSTTQVDDISTETRISCDFDDQPF